MCSSSRHGFIRHQRGGERGEGWSRSLTRELQGFTDTTVNQTKSLSMFETVLELPLGGDVVFESRVHAGLPDAIVCKRHP